MKCLLVLLSSLMAELNSVIESNIRSGNTEEAIRLARRVSELNREYAERSGRVLDLNAVAEKFRPLGPSHN